MKKGLNKKINESSSGSGFKEMKLPKIINANQQLKSPNQQLQQQQQQQQSSIKDNPNTIPISNTKNNLSNTKNTIGVKKKININIPNKNISLKNIKRNMKNTNLKIVASLSNILTDKKISIEKLEEYKEKRKKRLKLEKLEEERGLKMYEQLLKEYKEKKKQPKIKTELNRVKSFTNSKIDEVNNIQLPKIKISEKKAQTILEQGGMLDSYKYLLEQLCKNGLPKGNNLFDYASYVIEKYEKKWKEKKYKIEQEKVENYWKEKKEQIENDKNLKESEIKALNRSIEEREINKIIRSLDRSRSSRHYTYFNRPAKIKSEKLLVKPNNKNKISVEQKEGDLNNNKNGNIINPSKIINNNKKRISLISNKSIKEDNKTIKTVAFTNKLNNKLLSPSSNVIKKDNVIKK